MEGWSYQRGGTGQEEHHDQGDQVQGTEADQELDPDQITEIMEGIVIVHMKDQGIIKDIRDQGKEEEDHQAQEADQREEEVDPALMKEEV